MVSYAARLWLNRRLALLCKLDVVGAGKQAGSSFENAAVVRQAAQDHRSWSFWTCLATKPSLLVRLVPKVTHPLI